MLDDFYTADEGDSVYRALWEEVLSRTGSLFGKLMMLASERNPNTGLYCHAELTRRFKSIAVHGAMRKAHHACFTTWLSLPVEEQTADISAYLDSLPYDRRAVLRIWRRLQSFRIAIPVGATQADRMLFVMDCQIDIHMLRRDAIMRRRRGQATPAAFPVERVRAWPAVDAAVLTPRELAVLKETLRGKADKEVASALDMSVRTVRFHLTSIFKKWKVGSRLELVARALSSL